MPSDESKETASERALKRLVAAGAKLEKLVAKIFEEQGFTIEEQGPHDFPDMILVSPGDLERTALEVKAYRSQKVASSSIRNAVDRMVELQKRFHYDRIALVATSDLDPTFVESVKIHIDLYDLNWLIGAVSDQPKLKKDLADLLIAMHPGTSLLLLDPRIVDLWRQTRPIELKKGAALVSELQGTMPGRTHARTFEQICEKSLKYLFQDELSSWRGQNQVSEGLHRPDLIAKIIPVSDFWANLVEMFRARFVVFEFKNYQDPIQQGQIYSTEKYLYSSTFRTVAIIIARNGSDTGADRAAVGALRESGKLIFCISLKQLEEMLIHKDNGDPPEEYLESLLDEFLLNIGR